MDYSQTVASLTPELVKKLKLAIELGKWEDGKKVSPEQLDSAMQAVILWEAKQTNNESNEPFVVNKAGELFTGKGESHQAVMPSKVDEKSVIAKNKV